MDRQELKKIFYHRQNDLLWIANSPVGKKLLTYELELPIIQVFPHSYRLDTHERFFLRKSIFRPKQKYMRLIDRFFTYERIAELFLLILTELDLYKNSLIQDRKFYPEQINWYEALLHYSGFKNGRYPLFLHTISTFTANGGGQGRVYKGDATYLTAHDAATGDVRDTGTLLGNELITGVYYVERRFAPFNTSTIGTGQEIVAGANTFVRAVSDPGPVVNTDTNSLSLVQSTQPSNTALAVEDFDLVGTTKFATDKLFSAWAADLGNNDFQLNSSGIANINMTGWSLFAWRDSKDISATAPTGANHVGMYNATNLLSVEYQVPVSVENIIIPTSSVSIGRKYETVGY